MRPYQRYVAIRIQRHIELYMFEFACCLCHFIINVKLTLNTRSLSCEIQLPKVHRIEMFTSRPLETPSVKKRQPVHMVQITADGSQVPIKDNWAERWCALPKEFEAIMNDVISFEVRSDDIFVVTFMKCGTTWMQETAWLLLNNLDFSAAKQIDVLTRSVFIDMSGLHNIPGVNSVKFCNKAPSPRLIKSHLPANLLPRQIWEKKQKTIYVARNVKDVVVSSYHFVNGVGHWKGSLEEYLEDFMNNEILYTPFWQHIVDFWRMRHEPFIFFVTYEEMKNDITGVIQRLCEFLDRPELTPAELKNIIHHLSFEQMKENDATDPIHKLKEKFPDKIKKDFQFMRRGIVGSFKDELTDIQQSRLDEWTKKCLLKYNIQEEDIFGKL